MKFHARRRNCSRYRVTECPRGSFETASYQFYPFIQSINTSSTIINLIMTMYSNFLGFTIYSKVKLAKIDFYCYFYFKAIWLRYKLFKSVWIHGRCASGDFVWFECIEKLIWCCEELDWKKKCKKWLILWVNSKTFRCFWYSWRSKRFLRSENEKNLESNSSAWGRFKEYSSGGWEWPKIFGWHTRIYIPNISDIY